MLGRTRLLIADGLPEVRQTIASKLMADPTIEIAAEAGDGIEAVSIAAGNEPNVALIDLYLPPMGGIMAIEWIKDKHPNIVVIALARRDNDPGIIDALQAGASSYILKEASAELLIHVVRSVSVIFCFPSPA
jgi:two-component system NarL family response regulator